MKRTLTEQYGLIKKGKGHKDVFLKEAKKLYPNFIRQGAAFNEASKILKQKNIINENFVGMSPINNPFEVKKKEGYETAFENFIKEAAEVKAEEKKVSKEVEEDQSRGYDNRDEKNPNNMIFGQIQMGYYNELKNPKNVDKTEQEIKDIVFKNLTKDPIYYTTNGQFGVEDLGYTDEAPSLGEPKEPKGPHKSSGYGTLKENKHRRRKKLLKEETDLEVVWTLGDQEYHEKGLEPGFGEKDGKKVKQIIGYYIPEGATRENEEHAEIIGYIYSKSGGDIESYSEDELTNAFYGGLDKWRGYAVEENNLLNEHSISMAGGIVTGGGFVGMDYMDYFGLNEELPADSKETADSVERAKEAAAELADELERADDALEEDIVNEEMVVDVAEDALYDIAEELYEDLGSIDEVLEYIKNTLPSIEQNLSLKYGDY